MPDESQPHDDERQVFDALANAAQQYEQYLLVAEASSIVEIWADVQAPPTEESLSLTIWPDSAYAE